jgi:hypothetical protein
MSSKLATTPFTPTTMGWKFVWVENIMAHYILYVGGELGWLINDLKDLQSNIKWWNVIKSWYFNRMLMLYFSTDNHSCMCRKNHFYNLHFEHTIL